MAALEDASVNQNIVPFTRFLAELVTAEQKGQPAAKAPEARTVSPAKRT
jgi:hypothetical protein